MLVQLAAIRPGRNIRQIPPTEAEQKAMKMSIAAQGILQSLLCRPLGLDHHLEVVCGFQRYEAAAELGIIEVEVEVREMTDEEVDEIQLAENLVRAAMHPVDVWRRVRALAAGGRPLANIAESLGRDERDIRRWERLGHLAPEMLELVEAHMPSDRQLREIAAASLKVQKQVAKGRDIKTPGEKHLLVDWDMVAARCKIDRIARDRALFNTATAKLTWEEDMFAPDGTDGQWYTTEVEKFRKLQYGAIRERCIDLGKQKPRIEARPLGLEAGRLELPKGFVRQWTPNLEKPKKFEVQFVGMKPDGSIEILVGLDVAAQRAAEKAAEKKAVDKARARKKQAAAGDAESENGEDPDGDDQPTEITNKPGLTQEGLAQLAAMRTKAVQDALDTPMTFHRLVQALVIALACDNVSVSRENYGRERFDDIARQMIEPGGNLLDISEGTLADHVRSALGRIIKFAAPKASGQGASGPWGEIIAKAVAAEDKLPRFDTTEFLDRVSGDEIRALFADYIQSQPGTVHAGKKTVGAMREYLAGKLPNWRPLAAHFGAPEPGVPARMMN